MKKVFLILLILGVLSSFAYAISGEISGLTDEIVIDETDNYLIQNEEEFFENISGNFSGENSENQTISLGEFIDSGERLDTLRVARINLENVDENTFTVKDEVESSYGNPMFNVIIAVIAFVIVTLTIILVYSKLGR